MSADYLQTLTIKNNMKKFLLLFTILSLVLTICGCSEPNVTDDQTPTPTLVSEALDTLTPTSTPKKTIELTEEEVALLQAMHEDIVKVSAENYLDVVADISSNTANYIGKVYQFEGVYSVLDVHGEKTPYIINTVNGEAIGLPLLYLSKEIEVDTPICVTAIIGVNEHDGHAHAALELVAIESI